MTTDVVIRVAGLGVVRDGLALIDNIDWEVRAGERWALLGPNGSGKTTLLRVVGSALWPTRGVVEILGDRLGHVDMRVLRQRIATVSASISRSLRPQLTALEVVLTGRYSVLDTWWHEFSADERAEADRLLRVAGFGGEPFDGRSFGLLSEGERQQVLLARAVMGQPELVLMDEPAAGLDLGARERLVQQLSVLADDPSVPALVLVTHHVEEIPPGITHAALLHGGRMTAAGPVNEVLTDSVVSDAFGIDVVVNRHEGRWSARAVHL
jgi:iron complex transport system ATP-binding protein